MGNQVSFDEDTTLGMPRAKVRPPGGMVGILIKLGLAGSPAAANIILICIAVVALALTVVLFYRVASPSAAVQPVYDSADPARLDQTL